MLELLRDPAWQFAGVLLAVMAIAVAVWVYFAQKQKRRLSVEKVSGVPLFSVGPNRIAGLQITLNGLRIDKATVVVVRVTNTGNAAVPAVDFEDPICLAFEASSEVLNAEISSTTPESIPISVTVAANKAIFSRSLLNPGDSFTCRLLVKDSSGKFSVRARIVGVRSIDTSQRVRFGFSSAMVLSLATLFISVILTPKPMSLGVNSIRTEELPYLFLSFSGFIVMSIVSISDLRSTLRRARDQIRLLRAEDDA